MQQGDNLGPLLFSLALHPLLLKLNALKQGDGERLDIVVSYLDNVVIAGDSAAVLAALRLLMSESAGLGLELNLSKCELIPTQLVGTLVQREDFPGEIKWNRTCNFELLGAPIGSAAYCEAYTRENAFPN